MWTSLSLSAEQVRFRSQYPLKIILSFKPIAAPKFNSSPLKTYQPKERIIFQKPFFTGYFTCQTSLRFFALESQDIDSAVDSCPKETVLEHYLQQSRHAQILPRHHISWPLKEKTAFGFLKKWREDVRLKNGPPQKHKYIKSRNIVCIYIYINIFKRTWGSFFCPIAHPMVFYNQKRLLPTLPRSPNKMLELLLLTRFAGNRMPGTIKVSQKASSVWKPNESQCCLFIHVWNCWNDWFCLKIQ